MDLKITFALMAAAFITASSLPVVYAEETAKEKVTEAASDTKKEAKQLGRKVKDETCELVNGKMECVGKKIKNKAKNAGDEVKDATH